MSWTTFDSILPSISTKPILPRKIIWTRFVSYVRRHRVSLVHCNIRYHPRFFWSPVALTISHLQRDETIYHICVLSRDLLAGLWCWYVEWKWYLHWHFLSMNALLCQCVWFDHAVLTCCKNLCMPCYLQEELRTICFYSIELKGKDRSENFYFVSNVTFFSNHSDSYI